MAHFAEIDENNIVRRVVAVDNKKLVDSFGRYFEFYGIEFCKNMFGQDTNWKQTSYNTRGGVHLRGKIPLRKNFASVGSTYDETLDAFIPLSEYPSYVLNEEKALWEPPVQKPSPDSDGDQRVWVWDEDSLQWIED